MLPTGSKLRFEARANSALFENAPIHQITSGSAPRHGRYPDSRQRPRRVAQEGLEQIGTIAKSGAREFFQQLATDRVKDANLIASSASAPTRPSSLLRPGHAGDAAGRSHGGARRPMGERGEGAARSKRWPARARNGVVLRLRPEADDLLSGIGLRRIRATPPTVSPCHSREESVGRHGEAGLHRRGRANKPGIGALDATGEVGHRGGAMPRFLPAWRAISSRDSPTSRAKVEGRREHTRLFSIPQRPPFNLWDRERRRGIKIWVPAHLHHRRCESLVPDCVSDSCVASSIRACAAEPLPRDPAADARRPEHPDGVDRAGNGLFDGMARNRQEKYPTFWKTFIRVLKEGAAKDTANRDRRAKLVRFASTREGTEAQSVSLTDYIARMKDGQEVIYYITADGFAAAQNSPHREIFRKLGVEVMLMSDRIDQSVVLIIPEFEGHEVPMITKGDLDLADSEVEPPGRSRRWTRQ